MDLKLYNAIYKCDVDVYKQFKEKITEQLTGNQNTVLHVIAQHNDSPGCVSAILLDQSVEVVKYFLTWKNSVGDTALCIAARNNRIEMLKLLIEKAQLLDEQQGSGVTQDMMRMTNENGDTALHEAVKNKRVEIVRLLVKGDPDDEHLPNNLMKTPLYLTVDHFEEDRRRYGEILELILSNCTNPGYRGPGGETAQHVAARSCSGAIERIHEKNPSIVKQVDDQGFTPLHHAAMHWYGESAKELLKINKRMAYVRATDKHDRMTPIHIAASKGHEYVMKELLQYCPDCWDMTTSNGRNILHLAAENQFGSTIKFILEQPWSMNLINETDKHGNTPIHLLLSSMPLSYRQMKDLAEHREVDFYVINMEGCTPYDLLVRLYETGQLTPLQIRVLNELRKRVSWRHNRQKILYNDSLRKKDDGIGQKKRERLEEMRLNSERHLLVATLIATVTFAASFTLPGGYDSNPGPNQGMAVSIKKAAFKTFVVTNTLAVISSYAAIFLHFSATFYKKDELKLSNRYESALGLLLFSMVTMVIAFITGMFTVLDKSLGLAVTVCIIGGSGILFLLYLVYRGIRDVGDNIEDPYQYY